MCSFAVDRYTGVLNRTGGTQCGSPGCGFLSLRSMGITAIAEGAFSGMVHLSMLDLSANYIHFISPGAFKDLTSLMTLNLNSNALTVLQNGTFQGLSSLETLSLQSNYLSGGSMDAGAFQGLSQLRTLDLNNNRLYDMRAEGLFSGMPQLRNLSMQGQVTYYKFYLGNGTFSGNLSQLVSLEWSRGCCNYYYRSGDGSVIERGAFDGLTGLENLVLHGLQLDDAGMPSGLFQQCRSLKHLDLDYNLLSSITEHTFSGLWYSVETLDLYGNTISNISSQAFSGFQKLRSVTLGNNQLSVLPRNVFTNLTADGCSISLGDNPLTCLPEKPPRGELFFESSRNKSLPACPSEVR